MQRPYYRCSDKSVNNDDPMYMIWHDNEWIQHDKRKMNRDFIPHPWCNLSDFRQRHIAIDQITKPFLSTCCANCDKIFSWQGVIPAGITQWIVSESIPEQRVHKSRRSDFIQYTKLLWISKTLLLKHYFLDMYIKCFQTFFWSGQRRTDFFDRKNELEMFYLLQDHHLK